MNKPRKRFREDFINLNDYLCFVIPKYYKERCLSSYTNIDIQVNGENLNEYLKIPDSLVVEFMLFEGVVENSISIWVKYQINVSEYDKRVEEYLKYKENN